MMIRKLQKTDNAHLHVAHQSELVLLRNQVAGLQEEILAIKKLLKQDQFQPSLKNDHRITVSTHTGVRMIDTDKIIYCKAIGNYTQLFIMGAQGEVEKTSTIISKSLKHVIEKINHDAFLRCHQSYLINMKYTIGLKNYKHIKLSTDTLVPVSRRRLKEIKTQLK